MPILLILLVPVLVRLPFWLVGLRESPMWATSGLTLPGTSGLPGLPGFLDLNAGWTTQALGTSAAHQWLSGQVPWWDPFTGIGMPLAAEMQSSALFLPYILLLALPGGTVLLNLALQWTAGLATWRLLLRLDLSQDAAVFGALLFELCASFAWMGPPAGLPVAFLPLFVLGLERARAAAQTDGPGGWRVTAVAVALSLYAGFPETAYLNGLLALVWAGYRLVGLPGRRLGFAVRVAGGGLTGLLLAAPVLWPFFDLLRAAHLGLRDGIDMSGIGIAREGIVHLLTPYALGLPAGFSGLDPSGTLVYLWGRTGGYVGVVLALAAIMGAMAPGPNRGLRWVLLAWTVFMLAKVMAVDAAVLLFSAVPFDSQMQVFRYSGAAWLFPVCILAAHAVERTPVPWRAPWRLSVVAGGLLLAGGMAAWVAWPLVPSVRGVRPFMLASLIWGAFSLLVGVVVFARGDRRAIAAVVLTEAAVLFAAPFAAAHRRPVLDIAAIEFLQTHLGLHRFATLGPFQPNYGALFGIASVNTNYLPSPRIWSEYVQKNLRPGGDPLLFVGNYPPDAPGRPTNAAILAERLRNYADLGVKYVIAPPGPSPFGPAAALPPAGPREAFSLGGDAMLSGRLSARPSPFKAVTVTIGTFQGRSTGTLQVELCSAVGCIQGRAPLTGAQDNQPLVIPLDRPVTADEPLTWTLRHVGSYPVAIWRWSGADGPSALVEPVEPPRLGEPALVYTDAILSIFEVPDPAPYVSAEGGPCALVSRGRTVVEARCEAPATMVRRELMWPGWRVWIDGVAAVLQPSGELFQSVALPAGSSHVEFRYWPPGGPAFMALFVLGALGLLPWDRVARRFGGRRLGLEVGRV